MRKPETRKTSNASAVRRWWKWGKEQGRDSMDGVWDLE
jgi:hypothetical protein